MGRTFKSVRMGSHEVAARWLKASRALRREDQIYGQRLAEMAKIHSSEAFYALDDPLEEAAFPFRFMESSGHDPSVRPRRARGNHTIFRLKDKFY